MFSITCQPKQNALGKDGKLWCFNYTFEDGSSVEDEPLMAEATELVNRLLKAKYPKQESFETININFSETKLEDADLNLEYIGPEDDGSTYSATNDVEKELQMEVWLCPVLDQFFTDRPENLYITITI
tara:strand:+ start:177 stop:560 length:384 start_codon:yes stop_codon:yes gene_type:complete